LQEVYKDVHNKLLNLRRVEHFINTQYFKVFFKSASLTEQIEAKKYIDSFDLDGLKKLIDGSMDLAELGIRRLRNLGKMLGIIEWYKLPKSLLLIELERIKNGSPVDERDAG
jgi:hypothetical protein